MQTKISLLLHVQNELREQIIAKETSNSESLTLVEECLRKKYERDMEDYRGTIARQEATIAAHQERLNKALKAARRNNLSSQYGKACSSAVVGSSQAWRIAYTALLLLFCTRRLAI